MFSCSTDFRLSFFKYLWGPHGAATGPSPGQCVGLHIRLWGQDHCQFCSKRLLNYPNLRLCLTANSHDKLKTCMLHPRPGRLVVHTSNVWSLYRWYKWKVWMASDSTTNTRKLTRVIHGHCNLSEAWCHQDHRCPLWWRLDMQWTK